MSINAFSGNRLEQSGVHDITDLQGLAAGLHIGNVAGLTKVSLRGIGTDQLNVGAESGVATHRDGVFLAQRIELGLGFFDVERVEVLKGPQGTLYGRNATGGAVNLISNGPTEAFETGGSVTYGNYELLETTGYASGSLIGDKLTARVAYKTQDREGYTPNRFNGEGLDNGDYAGIRGMVLYKPTADFTLNVTVDVAKDNGRPVLVAQRGRRGEPITTETLGGVLPAGRVVNLNSDMINEKESSGVSAKLVWDMGYMVLSSLSAYRKFTWFESTDWDGTDFFLGSFDQEHRNTKQFSQELTLASAGEADLEWIVGAFYFYGKEDQYGEVPLPTHGFTIPFGTEEYTTDAYAVFGEASYPILERLTLTLGARYSYEEKSIIYLGESAPDEDNWSSITPKVALTYTFSDEVSAYATVGKGFKSGGYNGGDGVANPVGAFDEEEVTNYEIGLKAQLFDDRLRTNISAFYMDYADLQQVVQIPDPVVPGGFRSAVINAASAEISGIELDLEAQPTDSLRIDTSISWLDASFADFPDALNGSVLQDASGNRLPNAPEWAFNLGANYTVDIGGWGTATLCGEYAYKSRTYYSAFQDNFISQEGYGLLNTRLTFEDASGKWRIAGWVKNITDEETVNFMSETDNAFLNLADNYYNPPRTYGITIAYDL